MKRTAGKIAISDTKTNAADLVTESDLECQRVIEDIIRREFPHDSFLGEENVAAGSLASVSALGEALVSGNDDASVEEEEERLLWIVDPIDGTTNFQAGLPIFCTSIGVVSLGNDRDGSSQTDNQPEVVVGVIYNPILEEYTCAVRGRGCYVNGKRVHKSTSVAYRDNDNTNGNGIPLNRALVNVGFPVYSESLLGVSSKAVAALATKVRGLRMVASASQVMAWVAQGKFDAYVSWDLNAWDVAAGMVIVEESGGFVSNFDGTRADVSSRDMIVTCNEGSLQRSLSCELREVLEQNDCFEY